MRGMVNRSWGIRLVLTAAALIAAALAAGAAAATTYSATVDVSSWGTLPAGARALAGGSGVLIPGAPAITLGGSGDNTVSGTILFGNNGNNQVLNFPGPAGYFYFSLYGDSLDSYTYQYTTKLHVVSGSTNVSNPFSGLYGQGGMMSAIFPGITGSAVSISGFDYTLTLLSGGPVTFTPALIWVYPGTGGTVAGAETAKPAGQVALRMAGPNPFAGVTRVEYELPTRGRASLALYSPAGQKVRTLMEGDAEAGVHGAEVNARGLPAGVYFLMFQTEIQRACRRMTLLP